MKFLAYGATVTGPRHLDLKESNQDAMALSGNRGGWIAAVADGLGSRSRSAHGARHACLTARKFLRNASSELDLYSSLPAIHQQWLTAIMPINPKDAATTLIFARVSEDGIVHAAQLGDGFLLVKSGGKFSRITPERTAFGNQTWALEKNHLQSEWVTTQFSLSMPGDGLLLMTDGVSDDIEPSQLDNFFNAIYRDLSKKSRRKGRRWLDTELNNWATPMHSDDKTLVAIFGT
jgi:serine/threonine protein phosphatase PrpC